MSDYKLKTGKIGETVIGAYKKVEDAFVDKFLEKGEEGETDLRLKTGKVGEAVVKGYKGRLCGYFPGEESRFGEESPRVRSRR